MNLEKHFNLVLDGGIISYKALFSWLEPKTYLTSCILLPFSQILFFAILARFSRDAQAVHYVVIGNSMQIMSIAAIVGSVHIIAQEKQEGTLQSILGTPANRILLILGRMFMPIADSMIKVFMGFLVGIALFDLAIPIECLPRLAFIVLIACFGMVGFGLLVGTLGLIFRDVIFLANTFYYILLVLCGVNFPIERLPQAVQYVSKAIPLTYGIQNAREIITSGVFSNSAVYLCVLLGVIYLLLSVYLFEALEERAKKYGTLERF